MKVWLLFGAALLFWPLSACGVQPTATGLTPSPQPTADRGVRNTPESIPSPSAASTVVPQTPLASGIPATETAADAHTIAILERSGGFAGTITTFVVKSNGDVIVGGVTKHVAGGSSAAVDFAAQLEKTGIYTVSPGEYLPKNTCCDRYNYELTLMKDGKTYRYRTIEDAENTPPELRNVIALVQKYVGTAR